MTKSQTDKSKISKIQICLKPEREKNQTTKKSTAKSQNEKK